jgi:hypothetical protein
MRLRIEPEDERGDSNTMILAVAIVCGIQPRDVPEYVTHRVHGWTLKVERALYAVRAEWTPVRFELEKQLYQISRVVPVPALAKLREVTIWVHHSAPDTRCMAYHPDRRYLQSHGMNPEMEKDIEVGNAKTFLAWTIDQPWMVFHELAHAYHDRFLDRGFATPAIVAAYQKAMDAGLYAKVMFWDGRERDGYARTNPMEYFAELSEAYFGCNDMFPFVRGELRQYDRQGFEAIEVAWGLGGPREPPSAGISFD